MKSLADCRLYGFVDTAYLDGRDPAWLAEQLCAGGADLVQVRAKGGSEAEVRELVRKVLPVLLVLRVLPVLVAQLVQLVLPVLLVLRVPLVPQVLKVLQVQPM